MPVTHGIRPAALFGANAPVRTGAARTRMASIAPSSKPVVAAAEPELPTIEIIRGDKRAHEVVRQEQ
jgi:hypothetical protein